MVKNLKVFFRPLSDLYHFEGAGLWRRLIFLVLAGRVEDDQGVQEVVDDVEVDLILWAVVGKAGEKRQLRTERLAIFKLLRKL